MLASRQRHRQRRRRWRGPLRAAAWLAVPTLLLGGCAHGTGSDAARSADAPAAIAPPGGLQASATAPQVTSPAPTSSRPTSRSAPPQRTARPTAPGSTPVEHCAHNEARQLVLVSLHAQHAWFCAHGHTVFDTPVTTGKSGQYTRTPTGRYHIQGRDRHTTLTLKSGRQYQVQYWIPFDAPLFGFHDSSWQHFPYGSQQYRTRGSHGCVHVPLAAMKHFYEWVHVGASVTIRR